MKKVTSLVDTNMIERTKLYLFSRKDGKGGFLQSEQALDSFGRAPQNITNAYIVWALTSTGEVGLEQELDSLVIQVKENTTQDPYFVSLVAASLFNVGRNEEGYELA